MPVQASNRLFKLFYRTDRLEVYPYATGWRSTVRTGRGSIRTLQAGGTGRTGCPTRSVADCTTEIFVLVPSVSRTAKYPLATGTPEEISPPRNVVRSVQIPLTDFRPMCHREPAGIRSRSSEPVVIRSRRLG
jgi:hypothetical protein